MDEWRNFVTTQHLQSHWKILPAELLHFIKSGLPVHRQTGIVIEAEELLPEKTFVEIQKELLLRAVRDSEARKCRRFITLANIPSSFHPRDFRGTIEIPHPNTPATTETLSEIDTEAKRVFEKLKKRKDNQTITDLNTFLFKREEINQFAQLHELKLIDEAEAPPQDSKTTAQTPMSVESCVPEMEDLGFKKEKSKTWNELVKPRWYSGRDIVDERGITIYELFDYMKKGLQAYTGTVEDRKKVVDSDFLLKERRYPLAHIEEQLKLTASLIPDLPLSEDARKFQAELRWGLQPEEILNRPKYYEELISFDEMANNDISKVLDFQFKAVDIDKFVNEDKQSPPLPSEETQNETADPSALSQIDRVNMAGELQQMQGVPEREPAQQDIASQVIEPIKQPQQNTNEIKDYDSLIRSLQVSFVSDTEIRIKGGGKNAKTYDMKDLEFSKEKSKAWKAFITILNSKDHHYHVGKARGAKRERKTSYDVGQKVLVAINEKLVPFLNKTYQLQLTGKYKVYELIPEKNEAPGTYRFKFQITNNNNADVKGFEELSKDELLKQIEELSETYRIFSKRGDEKAETLTYNLNPWH